MFHKNKILLIATPLTNNKKFRSDLIIIYKFTQNPLLKKYIIHLVKLQKIVST